MNLSDNGDGSYSASLADFLEPFRCMVDDYTLDCEDIIGTIDYTGEGIDAVVDNTTGFSAEFSDESTGAVSWRIELSCEGSGCGEAEAAMELPLPCEFSGQGTATHIP